MHVDFKRSQVERMPACCRIQTRQKKKVLMESDEDEEHLDPFSHWIGRIILRPFIPSQGRLRFVDEVTPKPLLLPASRF